VNRPAAAAVSRPALHLSRCDKFLVGMRRFRANGYVDNRDLEHRSAIEMCEGRRSWAQQNAEGRWGEYVPNSAEIAEPIEAQKAFWAIIRHGQFQRLEPELQCPRRCNQIDRQTDGAMTALGMTALGRTQVIGQARWSKTRHARSIWTTLWRRLRIGEDVTRVTPGSDQYHL
jgi:hypothetical protein